MFITLSVYMREKYLKRERNQCVSVVEKCLGRMST